MAIIRSHISSTLITPIAVALHIFLSKSCDFDWGRLVRWRERWRDKGNVRRNCGPREMFRPAPSKAFDKRFVLCIHEFPMDWLGCQKALPLTLAPHGRRVYSEVGVIAIRHENFLVETFGE